MRPRWGDWSAQIVMEFTGDPPHMDLDNLAKAMLDSAVGAAFHDDSQVARLLVERRLPSAKASGCGCRPWGRRRRDGINPFKSPGFAWKRPRFQIDRQMPVQ